MDSSLIEYQTILKTTVIVNEVNVVNPLFFEQKLLVFENPGRAQLNCFIIGIRNKGLFLL